jgi:hypothetical protein
MKRKPIRTKPNAKPMKPDRSDNARTTVGKPPRGAPSTDQDPQRRLGNFTGTGEAPRKGYRTSGINGPQKRREASKRAKKAS